MATKNKNTEKGTSPTAIATAPKGNGKEVVKSVAPTVTQTLGNAANVLSQAVESAKNELTQRIANIETLRSAHESKVGELRTSFEQQMETLGKALDDAVSVETSAIDQLHATLKEMGITIPGVRIGRVGRKPGSKNKPKAAPANGYAKARVAGEHSGGRQKNAEGLGTSEAVLRLIDSKRTKVATYEEIMDLLERPVSKGGFAHPNANSVIAYMKRECRLVQTESRKGGFRFPTPSERKRFLADGSIPESGSFAANNVPVTIDDLL